MKCTDIRMTIIGVDEKTGVAKAVALQIDGAHDVLEELSGHENESLVDELIQFCEDVLDNNEDAGKLEIGSKNAKTLDSGVIKSVDEVLAAAAQKKGKSAAAVAP